MAASNYKQDLKGAWLVGVMLILYIVGGEAGFYLSDWSFFYSPEGPGVDPPFYDIRRDFVYGVCVGLTGFISLAVGLYYRKRYPPYAWMTVWMTVLGSGRPFVKSVIIMFKTTYLFTPADSTSSWLTWSEFRYDPLFRKAQIAVYILAGAIAILSSLYYRLGRQKQESR